MTSERRSIEAADHDMGVHFWLLSLQGNVAGEGEHLDLLVDAEAPILPSGDVELAEDPGAQGADSREVGVGNLLNPHHVGETPNHFFSTAEDNREPSLAFDFLKRFDMYGVKPDIPGFHYYDKRAQLELHFPEAGSADFVETRVAAGRRGILEGGSCYGCVFTGGAENSLLTFARLMGL